MEDFVIFNSTLVDYNGAGGDITIPDNVTEIKENAFKDCKEITGLTIPDGVKIIGESAFEGCTAIERVTVSDSVDRYGIDVFKNCTSLKNVVLGAGASLNHGMFEGYTSLEDVTIPNGVDTIMGSVFKNCTSLRQINLPADMKGVDESVFYGCTSLERIDVAKGNQCFCSVDGVLYSADKKTLLYLPVGGRTEYTIPENVKEIATYACVDCENVTITLPRSLKAIGDHGDNWCYKDCDVLSCFSGSKFYKGFLKRRDEINANLADVVIANYQQLDVLDAVWVYLIQSSKKLRAFTEPKLEENPAETAETFINVLISNKFTAKQYNAVEEFFTKFKYLIPKGITNQFNEMKKLVK